MRRLVFQSSIILFTVVASISPINNPDSCYQNYSSDACTSFISEQRHVTLAEAHELRRQALALYANEETPVLAAYDRSTLAVACLAYNGLRPGPDSDCVACQTVCSATSTFAHCQCGDEPAVCALYCTRSKVKLHTTQRLKNAKIATPTPTRIEKQSQRQEEHVNVLLTDCIFWLKALTVLVTVFVCLFLVSFVSNILKRIKMSKRRIRHERRF